MNLNRRDALLILALACAAMLAVQYASACQVVMVPQDVKMRFVREDVAVRRPIWRPPQVADLPFRITNSKIAVRVQENLATTTLDQTFLNMSGQVMEVRVLIPLPKGAAINKSALSMDNEMVEGKLLNANEAQGIYESIVSQRRDPALLRFAGDGLYEARIFPIQPNQERTLRFAYDQVLTPVNGLYDYRQILSGSQMYRYGVEKFAFECTIQSKTDLGPVYSPSHTVAVERPNTKTAVVKFGAESLSTDKDFQLYYAPSTEDVALRMMTHRVPGEDDGYFMLLGRPDDQLEGQKLLSKELVLVLDVSGSMAGAKMDQAKKALTYCLSQLNPRDRFNVISFSTEVNAFSARKLLDATKENVKKALDMVDTLEATGGTNISEALTEALANDFTAGPAKAKLVIFITDGLPSVGVTDSATILKEAGIANQKVGTRVFAFGVGNDVNTHLLDKLTLDADGASAYVAPKEDLELKVSGFYAKVKNPVMTDVKFEFGEGAKAHSLYPRKVPALFKGDEILLTGRFKGTGGGVVTLKGNVGGETREIKLNVTWPTQDRENAYLPRLWAMRKIGHLLEDVRLRGSNQETIDEIVTLAQRHGIVTPYTSQLVVEPNMNFPAGPWGRGRPMPLEEMRAAFDGRKGALPPAAAAPGVAHDAMKAMENGARQEAKLVARESGATNSGGMAVGLAETERLLKDVKADAPAPRLPPADRSKDADELAGRALRGWAYRAGGKAKSAEDAEDRAELIQAAQEMSIKQVKGRTFYLRQGIWIESTLKAKAEQKPTVVKAFSKEYFELLKKNPDLGAILALGGRILVEIEGTLCQIEPDEQP